MNWKTDPPTAKQLWLLKRLGCSAVPRTKGEACDLIAARVPPVPKPNAAEIVDKAAERAKQSLANEHGHYQEIDGVLIPPGAPLSTSTGPLSGAGFGSPTKPRPGHLFGGTGAAVGRI